MAFNPSNLVQCAKAYLGKPYVWGGESDAEGGFDCSGFVYRALNDSGVKVGRDTAQGYYNRYKGNKTDKSNAGAILFFGTSASNITHVAISLGGSKMIESKGGPKNTKRNPGKGVTESYISSRKDLVAACYPAKVTSTSTPAAPTVQYYPRYIGTSVSIVNALQTIKVDSSFANRKKIAAANGITGYSGTAVQNTKMLNLLKQGKLIKA